MRKSFNSNTANFACAAAVLVIATTLSLHAGVNATQGLGSSWVGTPDIVTSNPPSLFTVAENEYSASPPTPPLSLAQSFTATATKPLTNIQIYVSGNAVSNSIHLYDLGVVGGNPSSYTAANDLLTPGLGFQYSGGGENVLLLQFTGVDAVLLTNGHQYVFEIVPESDNQMGWYRNGADWYSGGEAYRAGSLLNGANRDLALAVTFASTNVIPPPPPPSTNYWINVTSQSLSNVWPGTPMLATYLDPTIPGNTETAVPEGFGPSGDANGPGRVLGQAFVQTNQGFNLGAIAIRMTGSGGTNLDGTRVSYFVSLFSVTNNVFSNTNTSLANRYPNNYKPSQDTGPLGLSMFGSNLVAFTITTNALQPGVVSGTNQFLILNFTNRESQIYLKSSGGNTLGFGYSGIYAFEITIGTNQTVAPEGWITPTHTNIYTDSIFQWVRGTSSIFETNLYFDPLLVAWGRFRDSRGSLPAMPRAYQSTAYTNDIAPFEEGLSPSDPRIIRTPLAGSQRNLVLALYAAPTPTIDIIERTYSSGNFTLRWTSAPFTPYSVYKKTNLTDVSWTLLTNNMPGEYSSGFTSFTDANAGPAAAYYRVSSP